VRQRCNECCQAGPFSLEEAVRREFQIKGWSRAKKTALIRGEYERLKHLSRSHD
jgi:predicted GIY-YIG superfamily endonuclease